MLACCGIDCSACPAYRGTVTSDITLLEKAAGDHWAGPQSVSDWACLGCLPADQALLARDCAACRIRGCATGKGVQNCAACSVLDSCGLMGDFLAGRSEPRCDEPEKLRRRLEWLRGRYLENGALVQQGPAGSSDEGNG